MIFFQILMSVSLVVVWSCDQGSDKEVLNVAHRLV